MDLDTTEGVTKKCIHLEYSSMDGEGDQSKPDPNSSRVRLGGVHGRSGGGVGPWEVRGRLQTVGGVHGRSGGGVGPWEVRGRSGSMGGQGGG